MPNETLTKQQIIQALKDIFEPQPQALAMWEGGASAFGRSDNWSDVDLQICVEDDFAEFAMQKAEQALAGLSEIELKYEIPQPSWHGHLQTFFRLQDASPYLLIDLVIMRRSNPNKLLEKEIHGQAVVHFDKAGITQVDPVDRMKFKSLLETRVSYLRTVMELFQVLTLKELNRRNALEAFSFYQGYTLRPLVEALRILYYPAHYNFYTRYLYYDLPQDVVQRLEELFFVSGIDDIRRKRIEAELWFHRTIEEIELIGLQELVEANLGTKE